MPIIILDELQAAAGYRSATLGPLAFVTLIESPTEQLGGPLETVGRNVSPGIADPDRFRVVLPVHGPDADLGSYEKGQQLRRQLRGLLTNDPARLQGLYFHWGADPELDGWIIVSTGELTERDDGTGPTFADWKLALDGYRVATSRSHREARALEAFDRRLATTPRDVLGRIFGGGFEARTARTVHALPGSVTELVGPTGRPLTVNETRGAASMIVAQPARAVVSFDRDPLTADVSDVQVRDRPAPSAAEVEWEQVHGPVHPLTPGDIPVLSNDLCRVRWDTVRGVFAVDDAAGAEGARVGVVASGGYANVLKAAEVIECTPERAVLRARLATSGTTRVDCYLTLQRGWPGPRIECYAASPSAAAVPSLYVGAPPAGALTYTRSTGSGTITTATDHGPWTGLDPWAHLTPISGMHLVASVTREADRLLGVSDTGLYGGTARTVAEIRGQADGYVSANLELVASTGAVARRALAGQESLIDARQVRELVSRS